MKNQNVGMTELFEPILECPVESSVKKPAQLEKRTILEEIFSFRKNDMMECEPEVAFAIPPPVPPPSEEKILADTYPSRIKQYQDYGLQTSIHKHYPSANDFHAEKKFCDYAQQMTPQKVARVHQEAQEKFMMPQPFFNQNGVDLAKRWRDVTQQGLQALSKPVHFRSSRVLP